MYHLNESTLNGDYFYSHVADRRLTAPETNYLFPHGVYYISVSHKAIFFSREHTEDIQLKSAGAHRK
jgi:hypothetical protein